MVILHEVHHVRSGETSLDVSSHMWCMEAKTECSYKHSVDTSDMLFQLTVGLVCGLLGPRAARRVVLVPRQGAEHARTRFLLMAGKIVPETLKWQRAARLPLVPVRRTVIYFIGTDIYARILQ